MLCARCSAAGPIAPLLFSAQQLPNHSPKMPLSANYTMNHKDIRFTKCYVIYASHIVMGLSARQKKCILAPWHGWNREVYDFSDGTSSYSN